MDLIWLRDLRSYWFSVIPLDIVRIVQDYVHLVTAIQIHQGSCQLMVRKITTLRAIGMPGPFQLFVDSDWSLSERSNQRSDNDTLEEAWFLVERSAREPIYLAPADEYLIAACEAWMAAPADSDRMIRNGIREYLQIPPISEHLSYGSKLWTPSHPTFLERTRHFFGL